MIQKVAGLNLYFARPAVK